MRSCNDTYKATPIFKVSKGAKIRNRYNQVPHLTQDTNGKVTNSQKTPQTEPRGQPFPSRWPQAHINRRAQRHSKHKTKQKHKRSTKEVPPWNGPWNILLEGFNRFNGANLTLNSDVDQDRVTNSYSLCKISSDPKFVLESKSVDKINACSFMFLSTFISFTWRL